MDLKRWIYSPDLARWLSAGRELDLDERMDCILSAPHRTLEEKLDGLRELRWEAEGERQLLDRSGTGSALPEHPGSLLACRERNSSGTSG